MIIKFWGVRGSIPSPGAEFVRYGGNTSCVSVQLNSDDMYIFDAGTGLKKLGGELYGNDSNIYIIHTHNHWDHIQGFPFFTPLYEKGRKIHVFKITSEQRRMCALVEQMDGAHFPVHANDLVSDYICPDELPADFLRRNGLDIESIHTNHPGGGYGYRINHDHHSIVYLTDNELNPPGEITTQLDEFVDFCKDADILIHDAQYIDEDMPHKRGWGHSLVRESCDLAMAANVKQLVLFHHDPDRTDDEIDALEEFAQQQLQGTGIEVLAAFEGMKFYLG